MNGKRSKYSVTSRILSYTYTRRKTHDEDLYVYNRAASDGRSSQSAARTASAPETETTRSVSTCRSRGGLVRQGKTGRRATKGTYADIGDLEVVDDERVALRAGAEVDRGEVLREAHLLGPLRVRVRKGKDLRADS